MNQTEPKLQHQPVLLDKVIEYLDIQDNDVVLDCTLGLGGHASHILKKLGFGGKLVGFDLDNRNMQEARKRLKKYEGKVLYVNDSYDQVEHYLKVLKFGPYNKVLMDLGVSSPHFDIAEYGFSFQKNGPLDMRFNKDNKVNAGLILNKLGEEKLAEIFFNFGEISNAKKLAATIVAKREDGPFVYTHDFVARIEKECVPFKERNKYLSCVFQALRIAVNDELNVLSKGLKKLYSNLSKNGIIAVISYHSLEDRIVKNFINELLRPVETSPEKALKSLHAEPKVEMLHRKIIVPSKEEADSNPRARSAKLRVFKKL
jgi:16S rRNA (cytosine1402-N4)-methyltransferase